MTNHSLVQPTSIVEAGWTRGAGSFARVPILSVLPVLSAMLCWSASAWEIVDVGAGLPGEAVACVDLTLDGQGKARIAFGGEALRYACAGDEGWAIDVIDSTLAITDVSICLEASGHPVIAWADLTPAIRLTWRDTSGWHREVVEAGARSYFIALRLDGAGCPHLCYHDLETTSLRYAQRNAEAWTIETVDKEGDVGWFCDLDLDGDGWPHLSYADYGSGDLKYARRDAAGWQRETVDADREVGWETSLRVDASGSPHIAYYDSASRHLRYALKSSGNWVISPVAPDYSEGGFRISLDLDSTASPHVAFADQYFGTLHYGWFDNGAWRFQAVDAHAWDGALTLDGERNPRLAYVWDDDSGTVVRYAAGEAGLSGEGLPQPDDVAIASISISPNPCTEWALIRFRAPCPAVRLSIFDMAGRCVEQFDSVVTARGEGAIRWIPSCAPGTYVVSLFAGASATVARLMVVR